MFPAYRNESWKREVDLAGEQDLKHDAPGPSYSSFSTAPEYDANRRHGDKDLEQTRKLQYEEIARERAKERKHRQKEEKQKRDLSVYSIKMVSIRSDDDSDSDSSDIVVEEVGQKSSEKKKEKRRSGRRKRKYSRERHKKGKKHRRRRTRSSSRSSSSSSKSHERKRHRRRRTRSSSRSSSSSSDSSRKTSSSSSSDGEFRSRPSVRDLIHRKYEKWSFMEKMDVRVPSSFFIIDAKGDKSNKFYESLYQGDVVKFELSARQILEGSDIVNRLMFPGEKKRDKKAVRYFDEKVRKTWSENPERFWRHKETRAALDFIPLSMEPLLEGDLPAEERHNGGNCDASVMEVDLQLRSQMINKMLGQDRRNVGLWLEFLNLQDQLHLERSEGDAQRKSKGERLTDGLLLERKMAIVSRALESNTDSVKLKIERVKIGCYVWEKEKLDREIADLEFYHVNDPEMWSGLLDIMKNERRYKLRDQLSKMAACVNKLEKVMKGQMRTHPAMPGTEQFVASVIRRRVQLLMQSGYVEKAVATTQAICEYCLCMPESITKCNGEEKRKYFEAFWDSGIARVGDIGAKGWSNSITVLKAKKFRTDKEQAMGEQAEYEKEEQKLIDTYRLQDNRISIETNRVWLEIEKLRAYWRWRPSRDLQVESAVDSYVMYEDVRDALFDFSESDIALQLILDILEDFGAVVFGKESTCRQSIMQQFLLIFPKISPQLREFDQFIGRFFLQLATCQPKHRHMLICSYITTSCALMQRREDAGNRKVTFKRFREVAKAFFTVEDKEETSYIATFAEKFLELGDKGKAIALAELVKRKGNLWDLEDQTAQMSCLRLALVYVQAVDSDAKKYDALANIIMRGTLPDANSPMVYEDRDVQARVNLLLTRMVGKESCSWQGSMLDFCATLTLLFIYYKSQDANKYRYMCSTYDSLYKKLDANQLLLFTKTFLNLLSSYMAEHRNKSPRLLLEKLGDATRRFPTCVSILKLFIDKSGLGVNSIPLRRFLAEDIKDVDALRCRCYGAVYLEFLRHVQLLALSDRNAPELRCVINALRLAGERMHFDDDYLPRIALHIAKERGDKELIREIFYMARANYPWSRGLLIDFAESEPDQFVSLADTMIEKDIRLHCLSDEIGILL